MSAFWIKLALEARRLREENALLRENLRIREQSQIPMIPRAIAEQLALLQAKLTAVEAVLSGAEEFYAEQSYDAGGECAMVAAIRNALAEPERILKLLGSSKSEPEPPYIARSGASLTRAPSGSDSPPRIRIAGGEFDGEAEDDGPLEFHRVSREEGE
jgi:hypothetical protein